MVIRVISLASMRKKTKFILTLRHNLHLDDNCVQFVILLNIFLI